MKKVIMGLLLASMLAPVANAYTPEEEMQISALQAQIAELVEIVNRLMAQIESKKVEAVGTPVEDAELRTVEEVKEIEEVKIPVKKKWVPRLNCAFGCPVFS